MRQLLPCRYGFSLLLLCIPFATLAAEPQYDIHQDEFPPRPTPEWVKMIDQGENDPRLKGLKTPAGIRVEIVAAAPVVVDPVGMTFGENGTPYVLQWRKAEERGKHTSYQVKHSDGTVTTVNRMKKDTYDELKTLHDTNGDGRYDQANVLMDDLEIPSSVLLHDGWIYTSSLGRVVRHKQSKPGGPFDVREVIVKGLCGFHHHQASGLTLSHDGWLYITSGDDDNHGEGSDGSRATVLRTGAVLRCRPDGSRLHEFARGFRNPYRDVAFDHFYNMFHVDNDQEDGSKFQGVRLMHVQEGADYGWRLIKGAVCCRTDFHRGAVFGEKPGKMPSMLKTGRGSPAGLLIYQGTAFPEFFRGLLIYPDVYRKLVRAYGVERSGSTFRVTQQFTLMTSDDGLFRPCQAVMGPDGAIYIVDWRTDSGGAGRLFGDGEHGRIYRLTWSGLKDVPAIEPGPMDAWLKLREADDATLLTRLDTPDFEIRRRALNELCRRGEKNRDALIHVALNMDRRPEARAAAIGGAARFWNDDVAAAMLRLVDDRHTELRRLAIESLARHATPADGNFRRVLGHLEKVVQTEDYDSSRIVSRAAVLALGTCAGRLPAEDPLKAETAKKLAAALFELEGGDAYSRDGFVRGLERIGPLGVRAVLEPVKLPGSPWPTVRHALLSLRTRDAAEEIDRWLGGSEFDKLSADRQVDVLRLYPHILVHPPIDARAVAAWVSRNPEAATETLVTALETIALVGGVDESRVHRLALKLLGHEDEQVRLRTIRAVGEAEIKSAAKTLVQIAADNAKANTERSAALTALAKLRSRRLPFLKKATAPGVETVTKQLADLARDSDAGPIRIEALTLLLQVDFKRGRPIAMQAVSSSDTQLSAAAINALGARPSDAEEIARRFLDGKIDRVLLPRVAEVLRRHTHKDPSGKFTKLLGQVLRGGLLVSLEPKEVRRVERLVATTGDPNRGRQVFLSAKSQCAACHQLEGVGGQVGPNLSKIYETHTVAKIMESMLAPSKEIKEGFATWNVTTADGKVFSGLKISDDQKGVVIRDATGRDIRIPADQVDEKFPSKKSLMPDGVVSQLSFQQFIDLVAFLKDRRAQERLRKIPAAELPEHIRGRDQGKK